MKRLEGKRSLITGGSSGIGREVAYRFAEEGSVVAVGGRDLARTQRTVDEIVAHGRIAIAAVGDLSKEEEARKLVEVAAKELGGLDTVVNNAGIDVTDWKPIHEWEIEDFDRVIATNLRGPMMVTKFAIPYMLKAGCGSFVHMSSVCAITVWAGDCGYDISKAALNMLSDHVAVEYGPQRIRSNTLMPGAIETPMYRSIVDSMPDGEAYERDLIARHPVGRLGTVAEVADACVFLCSDEAEFMTGANISIDGAYSRV